MCSDGILESNQELENKELWVKDMLENIETDEMRFLQQVLASEEWKSEAGFISGYNLTRSGQISVPK